MTGAAVPAQRATGSDATRRVARILIITLRFYQRWISPAFPPTCRFYPSCSAYAVEALVVHGVLRGCWLTLRRLLRCGPWHPGGLDPVPPGRDRATQDRTTERLPAESERSC